MPVVTAYATAVPSNPGGWANTANATGANNGTNATVQPARNVTAYIDLQIDPTKVGANIPAGATLVGNPRRTLWVGTDSNAQSPQGLRQWFINGVAKGTEESVPTPTGVTAESGDAPLTLADLQSATSSLVLRFGARRTGNQTRTFSLDAVRLEFEYVVGDPAAAWDGAKWQTGAEIWNGTRWVKPEVWNGTRWIPLGGT